MPQETDSVEQQDLYNNLSPDVGFKNDDFGGENSLDEELLQTAREVIFEAKKASASLLQRRLRVGYARAARILDIFEEKGLIGPGDGAKPREVYLDKFNPSLSSLIPVAPADPIIGREVINEDEIDER